jgi:hypothetical protein
MAGGAGMLLSIIIAVAIALSGLALAWIGVELTFHPPQTDSDRQRIRLLLGICAFVLVVLTVWTTVRSEKALSRTEEDLNTLPQRIAEYIRNTTPPVEFVPTHTITRPAPPTGLIVAVDGNWSAKAVSMKDEIDNFIASQGAPPSRKPGETDLDFIIRSNNWYSAFMNQYKKRFADQVITLVNLLSDKGALDKQVINLAKDPVNFLGVRELARQLEIGGRRYAAKYEPK